MIPLTRLNVSGCVWMFMKYAHTIRVTLVSAKYLSYTIFDTELRKDMLLFWTLWTALNLEHNRP